MTASTTSKRTTPHVHSSEAQTLRRLKQQLTLTIPEAALVLGRGEHTVRALVQSGAIPSIPYGKLLIVPTVDLKRYARKGK